MKAYIRDAVLSVATSAPFSPFHRALTKDSAAIFLLHRFADPDRGVRGHDPHQLRQFLAWLRARGIRLWDLGDLLRSVHSREPIGGGVCFTVDDGYADFATAGMDVFAEFDCPVTVFLTTEFTDQTRWLWWDQVRYLLTRTQRQTLEWASLAEPSELRLGHSNHATAPGLPSDRPLTSAVARAAAVEETVRSLIALRADQRDRIIQNLSQVLEIPLPSYAPDRRFEGLTWEEVRTCARRGARFGPHTTTHPCLAAEETADAAAEIEDSWARVREMVDDPVPVFAYPFGTSSSFGDREANLVREAGLEGAVTASPRFVRGDGRAQAAYRLPRFGLPDERLVRREIATGVLRLRDAAASLHPAAWAVLEIGAPPAF
jgi:peptidoglycan/xylan/chitin deacetylase (PgdA/CDA1 family)